MKQMHRLLAMLLAPTLLFGPRTAAPVYSGPERMVTEIEITCSQGAPARRYFSDQESISMILQYLRSVEFVTEETEAAPAESCYTITLIHSTGRITVYQQLGNRCLSKNNLPYQNLDPEQGSRLSDIYYNII